MVFLGSFEVDGFCGGGGVPRSCGSVVCLLLGWTGIVGSGGLVSIGTVVPFLVSCGGLDSGVDSGVLFKI